MTSELWGEAIRHVFYILNMLPPRALTGMTPYDACSGKKPHLEHIRIFGFLAYMKIPYVHVKKLDDRSKQVVYLGKEPGSKVHHLYDPNSKTVHVSRDVEFEESKGWAWHELQIKENQSTGLFVVVDAGGNIVETGEEQEDSASTSPCSPSENSSNSSEIGEHNFAIS